MQTGVTALYFSPIFFLRTKTVARHNLLGDALVAPEIAPYISFLCQDYIGESSCCHCPTGALRRVCIQGRYATRVVWEGPL